MGFGEPEGGIRRVESGSAYRNGPPLEDIWGLSGFTLRVDRERDNIPETYHSLHLQATCTY